MSPIKKKICLLGDVGVGKTSLIRRFVENIFDDSYLTTIGVKVSQKRISLTGEKDVLMMIWDVEGFNKPGVVSPNYFMGAAGAMVVCDLSRQESIENLEPVIRDFHRISNKGKIVLAGNKADLVGASHPGRLLFRETARQLDLPFFETSALNGQNVAACFETLCRKIIDPS